MRTGERLREAVRRRDPLGVRVEGYLKAGALVPDDVVAALVAQALAALGDGRLLFDGFPRTLGQVEILGAWVRERGYRVDCFLDVAIGREAAIARMGGRRVCPTCGANYHMVSHPPGHDEDALAVEKLGEGMRKFDTDARELKQFARAKMTQRMAS